MLMLNKIKYYGKKTGIVFLVQIFFDQLLADLPQLQGIFIVESVWEQSLLLAINVVVTARVLEAFLHSTINGSLGTLLGTFESEPDQGPEHVSNYWEPDADVISCIVKNVCPDDTGV
jgi:hypothetical protein